MLIQRVEQKTMTIEFIVILVVVVALWAFAVAPETIGRSSIVIQKGIEKIRSKFN